MASLHCINLEQGLRINTNGECTSCCLQTVNYKNENNETWGFECGREPTMTTKKELLALPKREIIRMYLALEERVEKVESIIKAFDNAHTPSSKKRKKSDKPQEGRFPGKPKGGNGGGIKMPPKDKTEEHTLDECPDCHNELGESAYQIAQRQLDLPPKMAICTEHVINHYFCSHCNKDVAATEISGRYGHRMKAYVASLKERGLSCQELSSHMKELGFISFSAATVIAIFVILCAKNEN